jgi:mycofactocin precursor
MLEKSVVLQDENEAPESPAPTPEATEMVERDLLVESDLLVEDVSIDGMCGVY